MASNITPIGLALKSKKIHISPYPAIKSVKSQNNLNLIGVKNLKTLKIRQTCKQFSQNLQRSVAGSIVLQKTYSLNDEVLNSSITGFWRSESLFSEVKSKESLEEKHAKILEICESGVSAYLGCCEFLNNLMKVLKEVFNDTEQIINNLQECKKSHDETKQTLKILKKRFQKLAYENLELNSSLSKKEKKIFRLNSKIKDLKRTKINRDVNMSITELKDQLVKNEDQLNLIESKSLNTKIADKKQFEKREDKVEFLAIPKEKFFSTFDNNNPFYSSKMCKSFDVSEKSLIIGGRSSKNNSFFNDFDFIF